MKPVMIIENNNNPLFLNEEFTSNSGKKSYLLGGTFTEFDIKNRNERVYTANKFLPCLEELNQRITTTGVYGEFDHPDVFDTSLSRASHIVKEAVFNQEHNRVEGKIQLLSTFWGKEARALVEDQCPIFVSSRAAGVTENDGTVTLKKLFTYDIVADPGFPSAKMNSINESLNYSKNANFRIYEMSDESKINDIFNMNNNDFVTKEQLSSYSNYLIKEIDTIKKSINESVKKGNMDPKKLEKLLEYYEVLNNTNSQMVKYLDYLAETVQVVVNENKSLKETSEKLIKHNDYLAENLEKAIGYTEYIAENVDKNIVYVEHLAENLDKTIGYTEYIAENLDKSIGYQEYLAENLDKSIGYQEYIAENLDKAIAYGEYIAENLDKAISYGEYIAENLENSIAYSEYLAEHVEGNIAYSEYIAEHLDDNIAYGEYIAENLDKAISYSGLIAEKLNGNKVNEDASSNAIPTLEEWGFENEIETEEPVIGEVETIEEEPIADGTTVDETEVVEEPVAVETTTELPTEEASIKMPADVTTETTELPEVTTTIDVTNVMTEEPVAAPSFTGESDSQLSLQIDNLIAEAKKRKIVESSDLHFLKFLNKAQVDSYYSLTNEEQELVKIHINGKSYFNNGDVLKLVQEALAVKSETMEERIVRLMPESVKPLWTGLNESAKKSVLSQAKLGYDLTNESSVEHFWYTRNLKKNEAAKTLVNHDSLIQEDKLSDKDVQSILERIKSLK
jgi:hypothetical protein